MWLRRFHLKTLNLVVILSNRAEWFVNFWRAQVENHFCEIIQNVDKKVKESRPIYAILVEGMKNISVKIF